MRVAQAAPAHGATEGSYTSVLSEGTSAFRSVCTAGLEKFPSPLLESRLWDVSTSMGSILEPLGFAAPALLSERVFC